MSGGQQTAVAKLRLPVITTSEMATFRRCQHEHHVSYVLGYRGAQKSESLRFGGLTHVGLEAWWKAAMSGNTDRYDAALEAMRSLAFDDFEFVRAGVLLQGYELRWGAEIDDGSIRVLAVEAEFAVELVNPATGHPSRTFVLGGKIDAVIALASGRVMIVEHKTTSSDIGAGSFYWQRLSLDPQIGSYYAGARSLGYDVAGCVYDVLGKPQLRPGSVPVLDENGAKIVLDANGERVRTKQGKWRETASSADGYMLQTRPETADEFRVRLTDHVAENPDRYYQRGEVVRLEAEERDAAIDRWHTARAIREAQLARRAIRNPDACERYGSVCWLFPVCSGVASLEDETLYRRAERTHEELAAAV